MTIKHYKKEYHICRDDDGKMIYAGDLLELQIPWETRTSYQSRVYWDRLHGAYVDAHPSHIKMGHSNIRGLGDFANKQSIKIWEGDDKNGMDIFSYKYTICKKVKSFYKK